MRMGKMNKKVIFLLAGWQNKLWMFRLFSKFLVLNGYHCITYAYDDDVLSPNTEKTIKHFNEVKEDILNKIKELKKAGYKSFSIIGISLGSVISLMVANKSPEISKIILNTTSIDLSETVWRWDKVNPSFKEGLTQQDLTLSRLKEIWRDITPANNISNLKDKKILVYLSEKDEVIPFSLGKRLIKKFGEKNYSYTLVTNSKLNHLFTGIYNMLNFRSYLNFLKA